MQKPKPLLPVTLLRELLGYDPESGSLYWMTSPSRNVKVGDRAGSAQGKYLVVTINGSGYKAHRVAWMLANGEDPGWMCVDHIDRNTFNNKLENLRLVSQSENDHNQKVRVNSSSGVTGVSYHKGKKKWGASISANGRRVFLGRYTTFEEAVQARKDAEEVYFPGIRVK